MWIKETRELCKSEIVAYENGFRIRFPELFSESANSDRAFIVDNSYYVNIQFISDIPFIGFVKLSTASKDSSLKIHDLFLKIFEEYQAIGIWRNKGDGRIEKLHNKISRRLKRDNTGITVTEYDNTIFTVYEK